MVKLTVLYGPPEDPAAFDEYYEQTHTPLVQQIPNLKKLEVARVVGTPDGSEPEYYLVAELYFDDMEKFQAAFESEEGQATAGDVPNFATGGATLLVCDTQG